MTRERTVLMLLAAGPASRCEIVQDTGWGIEETRSVVDRLLADGLVVPFPGSGNNQRGSAMLCLPKTRDEVLEQRRMADSRANTVRVRRVRERQVAW